jgi:hypothetical protein
MIKLLNKYDKVISLGSNCYIRLYLDSINVKKETHFFDNIGSSMWSINKLVENNFSDLFNQDDYCMMHISNTKDKYIYTHKKYYLIFKHDFLQNYLSNVNSVSKKTFLEFKIKYERRKERFIQLINNKDTVLFIRLEENRNPKIHHEIYEKNFETSELEYVKIFSNIIKKINPSKKFLIIFISKQNKNNYDFENNIITIKDILNINTWIKCDKKLQELFEINNTFLNNYFNF